MTALPTVLVVDDEQRSLESLQRILEDCFDVKTAVSAEEAEEILENEWVQVILCDQRMPNVSGVEFLKSVRGRWPDVVRMIISGYTDAEDIIRSINDAGIYQYVTKPWRPESLILTLKNAARLFELQRQNELLAIELKMSSERAENVIATRRVELKQHYRRDDGIIRSPDSPMNEVCARIARVAPYDISVLVTGESGTGKELVSRALHYNSLRWDKPFVVENCAAMPSELLESELFGHKRGAFTGAVEDHVGLFERADGGTVFLDEIGEVSPAFQVKLLRVLQEGEIRPVGRRQTRKVDIRVIAATNKDLEAEVRAGRFREDLYYRLSAVTIHVPALRDRRVDIPIISQTLLDKAQKQLGKRVKRLSAEAIACLTAYHWPGNVRELQNEIQQVLVMGVENEEIGADLLSSRILRAAPADEGGEIDLIGSLDGTLRERVESVEACIIRETLIRHRWNKSRAAKELGLSRVGLRSKLERYGLEKVEGLDAERRRKIAS
ncbi:two component sigma-54 specific Fis family transcriptional regulator [Hyphomicrobium denitrificans 1NES1]|uniref:Two component sigma-54 specific Fis family transcriptional regulator n=1 Tax=Hyphomicrobium denitrificans 1NES1 TaxID=670307 RepID=N0B563_9HYPH|nr:sigma-54 dependent transcriptional regulator [Hyphomicrobium denitrificans]AGK57352.1 two component sigma-54 specific Fis family transcriptional regulator [Hyphomicrobium denitrificans 1NES1]